MLFSLSTDLLTSDHQMATFELAFNSFPMYYVNKILYNIIEYMPFREKYTD